jgi:hypothetical protein
MSLLAVTIETVNCYLIVRADYPEEEPALEVQTYTLVELDLLDASGPESRRYFSAQFPHFHCCTPEFLHSFPTFRCGRPPSLLTD